MEYSYKLKLMIFHILNNDLQNTQSSILPKMAFVDYTSLTGKIIECNNAHLARLIFSLVLTSCSSNKFVIFCIISFIIILNISDNSVPKLTIISDISLGVSSKNFCLALYK